MQSILYDGANEYAIIKGAGRRHSGNLTLLKLDEGLDVAETLPLNQADNRGAGCFLQTATEDNVHWYERFGFLVADAYRPTPTWPALPLTSRR